MYEPIFELASFGSLPLEDRKHLIGVMCEALIAVNRSWLKRNPGTPSFYTISPAYAMKLRPFGIDRWQDIPQTLALREGDCKDFTCWRVAELREQGVADCGPRILATEAPGIISYHVQVRNDIKVEDPSVAMGMPKNITSSQLKALFTNPAQGQRAAGPLPSVPAQREIFAADIQELLNILGAHPPVAPTGVFDPQTAQAMASFQLALGMKPTGFADPRSVYVLQEAANRVLRRAA
jgi:hypothetical protein